VHGRCRTTIARAGGCPFATVVHDDFPGFDEGSPLGRPGVFRLNVAVGRRRFEELGGYAPAEYAGRKDEFDYAVLDRLVPHPMYGTQAWVAVVSPGERTGGLAGDLLAGAYERAREGHERKRSRRGR
jgi:Family of unknown function (DUF6194)